MKDNYTIGRIVAMNLISNFCVVKVEDKTELELKFTGAGNNPMIVKLKKKLMDDGKVVIAYSNSKYVEGIYECREISTEPYDN